MEVRRAWTRVWSVVGIALLTSGCGKTATPDKPGTTTPDPTDPEPQERLVPWQLEAEGAAPLTIGIFDQKRGEHCSFVPDRDGMVRCLPLPATTVELQVNYADAACTQPIYYAPYAKNARVLLDRNVAVPLPGEGCETRYAVGTLKEIPPTQRFYRSATDCTPIGPPAQEEGSHDFVLEREQDPEGWVSATQSDGPLLGGRVRLRRFTTDDQGDFDAQLVDERWDKPCTLQDASAALLCNVATFRTYSSYYVDSTCQGEHLWPAATCPEPAYIGDFGLSSKKYALGALWEGPIFSQGKVCEPADTEYEGQKGYWQRGEPLEDAVAIVSFTNEGTERLRLMGLLADDGSPQLMSDALFGSSSLGKSGHTPRYYDSQLDVSCRPIWTPGAGVRCVPQTTLVDPYPNFLMFADPECTDPAYLCTEAEASDCNFTDLVLLGYDENGEYRALSRRAAVNLSGEVTFSKITGKCEPNQPTDTPLFFRAGAELPWDEYPQLIERNGRSSGAK